MKTWVAVVVSFLILGAGGTAAYIMNERWNDPVVNAASTLGDAEHYLTAGAAVNLKDMIREIQKNVVSIEVEYEEGTGIGSGFLYNDKGDIVTNAHVIIGATKVQVRQSDSSLLDGAVIGYDYEKDVALVRVDALAGKEPLAVDTRTKAEIGDEVVAFGSPLGLNDTVTTGIISGVDRDIDIDETKYRGIYQISAPIAGGNSGGPLVMSKTGEVIGINSAGSDQGNIGFSIPIHQVAELLKDWSAHPDSELSSETAATGEIEESYTGPYTAADMKYTANKLVHTFIESLNEGDYATAYSLLGSDWQDKMSYESFAAGYQHTRGVTISSEPEIEATSESATVTLVIDMREAKSGEEMLNTYKLVFTVMPDQDSLKIVKGLRKKL